MMNARVKKMWLEALRSGEYKQGEGLLRSISLDGEDTFCCLGVLCDLYIKETSNSKWVKDNKNQYAFLQFMDDEDQWEIDDILPIEVARWAGIDDGRSGATAINPTLKYRDEDEIEIEISELNDGFENMGGDYISYSFEDLAKAIEEQW